MNSSLPSGWKLLAFTLVAWLWVAVGCRADTYAQWAARVFTAAEQADPNISGENACPAGDGVCNLMKFAFDLDPHKNGVSGLPTVGTVFGYDYDTGQWDMPFLALTYRYPSTYYPENITYVPEVSADLRALYGWVRGQNVVNYFGYQDPQNSGDPYLLTYSAASPISLNASLFMRLRVIEGEALPAEWLQQYFGTTTGINPDEDADGDGISNWQEFLNGTDPTDFYNGTLPSLSLAGGGNQRGSPGTVLPTPVTVLVNSFGTYNAPLTFTVTSGNAQLAAGTGSGYSPSATVNVRSITPFPDAYGYMTYAAQVYVYLPQTGNNLSTITVTAASGTKTTSIGTTVIASDPNVQPPSGFTAVGTSATTASLTWTPSDTTLATNLEVSYDKGVTWNALGSFAPGVSTGTLSGLTPDQKISLRLYTASANSGGTNGSGGTNSTPAPNDAGPADGSNPTGSDDVTPLSVPVVEGEQQENYAYNWSWAGFQTPANRYLHEHEHINNPDSDNDDDAGDAVYEDDVTVKTGQVQSTLTGSSDIDFTLDGGYTITSDTAKHGVGYDDDPSNGDDGTDEVALSNLYSLDTFKSDAEGWVPAFQGQTTDWVDQAHIYFQAQAGGGYGGGNPDSIGYDHTYDIAKLQYKFRCNSDPNGVVVYDIVFTPDDDSDPVHDIHVIQTNGATEVPDQPITLDPTKLNNKKNGSYQVIPVSLQVDNWDQSGGANNSSTNAVATSPNDITVGQGQAGKGDMVPSTKGASGQKHYVSPKKAGDSVKLIAQVPQDANFDSNFAWSYPTTTPACQVSGNTITVPRDTTGQYVIQVKVKKSDGTLGAVVDTINVWIVWATGTPNNQSFTKSTPTDYISTTRMGDSSNNVSSADVVGDIAFDFGIEPPEITDTDSDIPALNNSTGLAPVPGSDQNHPLTGLSLSGGADKKWNSKWDVSRKVSFTITNPNSVPLQYFSTIYSRTFKPNVVPSGNLVPFPNTPALGNDDTNTDDESNDPYHADTTNDNALLKHDINHLTSTDSPTLVMASVTPLIQGADVPANASITMKLDFQEFVRLQIGNTWFEVSDPVQWSLTLKLQLQNNVWIDQGSTITPAPAQ